MLFNWHLISTCLLFLWLCTSNALCPSSCSCKQTEKGKRKVSCTKGGMYDPLPSDSMDSRMEILEITAPKAKQNNLTISDAFKQFKHLEELRLNYCNILQIAMHVFWGVPSIKKLDLSFNYINHILDHNFRGLVNLVELNLSNNRISTIQSGVFKHLTELSILNLEENLITQLVPRIFLKLGKLHVLKISGNVFEELDPEAFKDIPDLRVLECRNCNLRRINTQIYHLLPYLTHLDLGNNRFHFIDYDEFVDLHRIQSIKLDGNQLPVVLEKTFIHQQQLKYLCLAKNRIAKITNTAFLNLTSLLELDISYNQLRRVENIAFQHIAETMQKLVISGNKLSLDTIKMVVQTLHRVKSLAIADMRLTNLPEKFLPDRIKVLNVSRNNITQLNVETLPTQLLELDISQNGIRGLNERAVLKLEYLKIVNLTGNPWSCNLCYITPILYRVNKTKMFQNLICASPKSLRNVPISSLQMEDVTTCANNYENETDSSSKTGLFIGLVFIVILAIFSIVFVVCSCTKRHARNVKRQQKRAVESRENNLQNAVAIFSKEEISFKFPLDLTERRMSVSTIDDIKKDTPHSTLTNGNASTCPA